jgi:hypothetical protein
MEPESSISCLQELSNGLYPEPDQSSPYHPILSKIHFNIIFPPTPKSSQWSLSSRLSHQNSIMYFFPMHSACPAIWTSLTRSFWLYLAKSTSYEALRYAVVKHKNFLAHFVYKIKNILIYFKPWIQISIQLGFFSFLKYSYSHNIRSTPFENHWSSYWQDWKITTPIPRNPEHYSHSRGRALVAAG